MNLRTQSTQNKYIPGETNSAVTKIRGSFSTRKSPAVPAAQMQQSYPFRLLQRESRARIQQGPHITSCRHAAPLDT